MAGSQHISRRDFVKLVTAGIAAVMATVLGLPLIRYLIDPALKARKVMAWIPLGRLEELEIGRPTLVNFRLPGAEGEEASGGSEAVYVVRRSEQEVIVLSNVCTHLACRVTWREDLQQYVCPCHDGRFARLGEVISGPPRRPLKQYAPEQWKVEDGILYLNFEEG